MTICFTIYFPKVVLWLPKHVIPESVGCFKSPAGTGYICPNWRTPPSAKRDFARLRTMSARAASPCSRGDGPASQDVRFPLLPLAHELLHRGPEFVGVHAVDDRVALGVELLLDRVSSARLLDQRFGGGDRGRRDSAPAEAPVRVSRLSVPPPERPWRPDPNQGLRAEKLSSARKICSAPRGADGCRPRRRCRRRRATRRAWHRPA